MNKRIYLPTAILLIGLLLAGCGFQIVAGSGKVTTENRKVGDFSRITLAGIGDVYVTQGDSTSVSIEAEDNLIPYFDTTVEGDTLKIGVKDQYTGITLRPTKPVKFHVTSPKVDGLTLAGSGNFFAGALQSTDFGLSLLGSGNITVESLTVSNLDIRLAGSGNINAGSVDTAGLTANIAGSGNIKLDTVKATTVKSTIAGSGDLSLTGEATDQNIAILGSGDYLAGGLNIKSATLQVTGSGNSQVAAADTLNVTILGSGDVDYSGSPHMNVTIAGSGKVIQSGK
jgi:hypothetical protein